MILYLIDADAALYSMDTGHEALTGRLRGMAPDTVAISSISYAEIAYGTETGKSPPPEILEAFVAAIPILAFDEAAARAYARLPYKRARFDRLLAAHALSISATVVTNNESDFADVPGLRVENWTLPL